MTNPNEDLPENENYISRDDLDLEVLTGPDNTVFVKFSGFEDEDEANEYADSLAEILPLLLFESTQVH
jgi:hypothetical protein